MGGIKITLITAIACKEGIVMGADSQVTSMPIKRKIHDKICKVSDSVLMAGSGSLSQIQKIQEGINYIPKEIKDDSNLETIKEYIKNNIAHPLRSQTLEHYKRLNLHPDNESIGDNAEILLAGFNKNKPTIFHLNINAMDTEFSDYHAIGFGFPFAQVILKNFDKCNEMNIERGKVVVYKVIKDAIETGAYSMDYPISIWVITKKNNKIFAEKIKDSEINAIKDTVDAINKVSVEKLLDLSQNSN